MSTCQLVRPTTSTPALDVAESDWWRKFAEVEEQLCWVQTPAIQQFLRGRYLRRIIRLTPPNGQVLEMGCGTGWLAVALAQLGCRKVVGLDFSETQLQIAARRAQDAKVSDRVRFELADASWFERTNQKFDLVLMHAFLHHLTTTEIEQALEAAYRVLRPDGQLVIWEPVCHLDAALTPRAEKILRRLNWLQNITQWGQRWHLYRPGPREQEVRALLAQRSAGKPPHGPSPKEMPFTADELPRLLAPRYHIQLHRRCMISSHLVAQENLLLGLSRPLLSRLLRWPMLFAARCLERRLVALEPPPPFVWIFEMFACKPNANGVQETARRLRGYFTAT